MDFGPDDPKDTTATAVDFFGEGCLTGQPLRMGSATALTPSAILRVRKRQMAELLHKQSTMSDRFISHMLTRNIRIEEDLIDQLFNSSEKTAGAHTAPAGALREAGHTSAHGAEDLTRYARRDGGTTRSRVSFFLNKFKKLGVIEYSGELPIKINNSLLSVVLLDCGAPRSRSPSLTCS